MPTDDVQDLFDTDGDDEGEEPTETGEGASESADDVAWDELESIDDEAGAGPAESDGASPSGSSGAPTGGGGAEDRPPGESGPSVDGGGDARAGSDTRSQDRERHQDDSTDSGSTTVTPDTTSREGGFEMDAASGGTQPAAAESTPPAGHVDDPDTEPSPGTDPDQAPPDIDSTGGASDPTSTESASGGSAGNETSSTGSAGSSRLPTGIDALDEAMGGGVPPGRLVLLVADPGVQSELIVDSVLAQRDSLFVSTDRPDWEVSKDIEPGLGSGEVEVRDHTPDSLLSGVDSLLDELGTSSNFVLDSVNELELVPRARYRIFLSDVKRRLFDTGSIGLLTGVTVGHESARDLTLRRADIVWRLQTRTVDHRIENRLSVPKFRGGAAVAETVKLELTDEVKVDSSWDSG